MGKSTKLQCNSVHAIAYIIYVYYILRLAIPVVNGFDKNEYLKRNIRL